MLELIFSVARTLELAVGWIFSPSWLPPKDFQFLRWLIVPGYGYGFVLIALGVLAGFSNIFSRSRGQAASSQADWTRSRDRKSTRLNSSHIQKSRMPSSA